MSRLGRYWLFFVIVAVGLAMSWGQIGRHAQRALEAQPVNYLTVETGCLADRAPCAALSVDRALVLGPAGSGLRVEQTGVDAQEIATIEASVLRRPSAEPMVLPVRPIARGWGIELTPGAGGVVRIRMVAGGQVSVADFPLSEPTTDAQ